MFARLTFLLALLTTTSVAMVPDVAWAGGGARQGERRPASSKAHITVSVVHATDSESGMDPDISPSMASQLRYFNRKGYRLLSTQSTDLAAGGNDTFSIEGGRTLTITLESKDEHHARVRVQLEGKKGILLDTTVKINRDGTFMVGGPKYKDGELYLPLKVSY